VAIPLATTTIAVLSGSTSGDPYESQPGDTASATGIRAHISTSTGGETVRGGQQEEVTFRLSADPVELTHTDRVKDEKTGEVYEVVWTRPRTGLGLDHVQAGLRQIRGTA
jgi:hypothetical protein